MAGRGYIVSSTTKYWHGDILQEQHASIQCPWIAPLDGGEQVVDDVQRARSQKGFGSLVPEAKRARDIAQAVGSDASVEQHCEARCPHEVDDEGMRDAPVRIQAVEEVLYPHGDNLATLYQFRHGLERKNMEGSNGVMFRV